MNLSILARPLSIFTPFPPTVQYNYLPIFSLFNSHIILAFPLHSVVHLTFHLLIVAYGVKIYWNFPAFALWMWSSWKEGFVCEKKPLKNAICAVLEPPVESLPAFRLKNAIPFNNINVYMGMCVNRETRYVLTDSFVKMVCRAFSTRFHSSWIGKAFILFS